MTEKIGVNGFTASEFISEKSAETAMKLGKQLLDSIGQENETLQQETLSQLADLRSKGKASIVFTAKKEQMLRCLGVEIGRTGKLIDTNNIDKICPGIVYELGIEKPVKNGGVSAVIDVAGNMTMVGLELLV